MKQNLFLNSLLRSGAILGLAMVLSHSFEQFALVYGGTIGWYSIMTVEMIAAAGVYIWLVYRMTKGYAAEVMAEQSDVKFFTYGAGLGYATAISALAGVIVGLVRYIIHNVIIGHSVYNQTIITSVMNMLKANPETTPLMSTYNEFFAQAAAIPAPTIMQTIFSTIFSYAVWGMIVGLIIAGFVRKEPNIFKTNQNE